jgi:hypothetical protein
MATVSFLIDSLHYVICLLLQWKEVIFKLFAQSDALCSKLRHVTKISVRKEAVKE